MATVRVNSWPCEKMPGLVGVQPDTVLKDTPKGILGATQLPHREGWRQGWRHGAATMD